MRRPYDSLMNAVFRHLVHSNRRTRWTSGSAMVVMKSIGLPQATHGGGGFSRLGGSDWILTGHLPHKRYVK
jgi:hypothetical protein